MLNITDLTKEYKTNLSHTVALEKINLQVDTSEFISIIGPSGCGKTTLLRILAGLDFPTSGNFSIKNSTTSNVGFVFQNYTLFPWLTVYENIAFSLKLQKKNKKDIEKIVNRYLIITGLDKFRNSYPSELSGGMKQRVAIARTLAGEPDLILMDEPFGALDVQTRSQMQEFLVKVLKEENQTVLMVTHDIEEAVYLSDKVVILSTKPGSVKEIVNISFSKPRKPEIKNQEEFINLKKSISYTLKSESIRSTTDSTKLSLKENNLKIGSNIWTGIAPLYLAQEKGIFDKHGVSAEIVTLEWSEDRIEPLRSGKVDALYTTLDSALIEISKNPNVQILMPLDVSFGGDAIISNKGIKQIEDLKNKVVGIEHGSVSHFFLSYVLSQHGLSLNDITVKDVRVNDVGKEMVLKTIDAASTQEPWLTKIKEYSEVTVLKTTRDYPPLIYGVLLVKKDTFESKKEYFKKFKKVWAESIRTLYEYQSDSIAITAPYLGISEVELAEQLGSIEFKNLDTGLEKAVEETEKILIQEGLIEKKITIKQIFIRS